jgi:hypothetical protein
MKNEQINTAMKWACGWKPETYGPTWHETEAKMPDYCNDLNAMHEAEKALGLAYDRWTRELREICERDRRCIESATARQRAEAFLRTIGKWEEAAK